MKPILERLFTVRGMKAAAVFDLQGTLLASHGEASKALESAAPAVFEAMKESAFTAAATTGVLRFASGTVVLRRNEKVQLMVLGDAELDVSDRGAAMPLNAALTALKIGVRRSSAP